MIISYELLRIVLLVSSAEANPASLLEDLEKFKSTKDFTKTLRQIN